MTDNIPQHLINMKRITASGETLAFEPDQAQLQQLAPQLGVEDVQKLSANLQVSQGPGNGITIEGEVQAILTQLCAVTNEPLETEVAAQFKRAFVPQSQSKNYRPEIIDGEMVFDPEGDDLPDIVESELINAWDVIIEELNLEIDPFPRADDTQSSVTDNNEETSTEPVHRPFADLNQLINEKKSRN